MWNDRVCPKTTEQIQSDDQQICGRNIQYMLVQLKLSTAMCKTFHKNANHKLRGAKVAASWKQADKLIFCFIRLVANTFGCSHPHVIANLIFFIYHVCDIVSFNVRVDISSVYG